MKLEVIPPSSWQEIFPDWEALLKAAVEPTIFLSPCWISSWWHQFGKGKRPCMVAGWDESRHLCALAPLYFEDMHLGGVWGRPLALRFMGDSGVGSEYLGLLVCPGDEEKFLRALSEGLRGQWTLADLHGLEEDGALPSTIESTLGTSRRIYREILPCSRILLPGDYESYLASLPQKFRRNIRSRTNKLVKNFRVNLLRTTREAEIAPHLERFFAMHQARWTAKGHLGSFHDLRKRAFYQEVSVGLLERGCLRFYHLEVDGVIRASQFGFVFDGRLHSLEEAFDQEFHPVGVGGVGVVLRAMAIKECISEGLKGYDFLGGTEPFKTRWNTITHHTRRVRIGAPGLKGAVAFSVPVGVLKAKNWGRKRLPTWLLKLRRQLHA